MFTYLYFVVTALLFIIALPILPLFALRVKHRRAVPARFFLFRNPPFRRSGLWFHACSLGETRALKPLLERLNAPLINITTVTQTGQEAALKYNADVRYLPFEPLLPFWTRPNRALIVLEAELWYLLFATARAKGAKVILLNARISERSFPKYFKFRWFYRRLFAKTERIFCQSDADKTRLEALGAQNVEVLGNVKLAQKVQTTKTYAKPVGETIIAASTHEGEEVRCLEAFRHHRQKHPDTRLLIVPRHPERFDAVWKMIEKGCEGETTARWSLSGKLDADVTLIDTMGELNNLYAIADTVILGGAFRDDVGGHNPLEPATFGCRIITGRHFFNQKALMRYVEPVQIVDEDNIAEALENARTLPRTSICGSFDLDRIVSYLNTLESHEADPKT